MMQVPSIVQPKSNPAMLTPVNCVRPVDVAVADADVADVEDEDEWTLDADVVEWMLVVEVTRVVLELPVPGRHCEYQGFEYVQTYPAIQVVAPFQPDPPPGTLSRFSAQLKTVKLTLSPGS
jgi:hypothetical protein